MQFLQELRQIKQNLSDKWLIIGDFNMILSAQDESNNNLNKRLMGAFRRLVNDLELKEMSLRGRKFTWSNDAHRQELTEPFAQLSGI